MSGGDARARWDARHAEAGSIVPGGVPFLDAVAERLPRAGAALDVAAGRGRISLWLLRHGLAVTACDVSPVGLALARDAAAAAGFALATVTCDLEREDPPAGPFDVVTCFHYLDWALYARLPGLLAPGGALAIEVATVTNLERSAHPSRRFLAEPGRLGRAFEALDVVDYDEGWREGAHVARLLARRP